MADLTATNAWVATANIQKSSGHSVHENTVRDNARAHFGDVYGDVIHNHPADAGTRQQEIYSDILRWLDAPDPSNDHYEAQRRYEDGTGEWFLDSEAFEDWLSGDRSVLWLYGPPGCCKTILCSAAIERTKESLSEGAPVYLFFTFRDTNKQTYVGLLLSVISQLLKRGNVPEVLQSARDLNRRHHSSLESIVKELIQQQSQLHLLIDGLDECPEEDNSRSIVMEGLSSLTRDCTNLKLLVASRKETDIEYFMSNESGPSIFAIEAEPVDEDIKLYVNRELERDRKLRRLSDDMKQLISRDLAEKAGGMFRWADLQLDSLKRLRVLRPVHVRETLADLPRTLDETYERILLQLGDSAEVLTVLRWVAFQGSLSFTFEELQEACITNHEQEPYVDVESRSSVSDLIRDMSSLLRFEEPHGSPYNGLQENSMHDSEEEHTPETQGCLVPKDSLSDLGATHEDEFVASSANESPYGPLQVSFAHRTVGEYLTSSYVKQGPAATFYLDEAQSKFELAQTCIAYLLHVKGQFQISRTESDMGLLQKDFPLLIHSLKYWRTYQYLAELKMSEEEYATSGSLVLSLLHLTRVFLGPLYLDLDANLSSDTYTVLPIMLALSASDDGTTIVAAAGCGLQRTLACLLDAQSSNSGFVYDHGSALIAAAWSDSSEVVEYLLSIGVSTETSVNCFNPAFARLSEEIYQLSQQALMISQDDNDAIKTWIAENIAKFMQLDPMQSCRLNAFRVAVCMDYDRIVSALCEAGVDTGTVIAHEASLSALQYACSAHEIESTIMTLLDAGADPNLPEHGVRPLWAVVTSHHFRHIDDQLKFMRILLASGADPNSGRDDGRNAETALQAALREGQSDVAQLLVNAGARHNYRIEPYGTEIDWKSPLCYWVDDEADQIIAKFLDKHRHLFSEAAIAETGPSSQRDSSLTVSSLGVQPWRRFRKGRWHDLKTESNAKSDQPGEDQAGISEID